MIEHVRYGVNFMSKDPKPTNISVREREGIVEVIIYFDNDRHHSVRVHPPYSTRKLAEALIDLGYNIARDPHLQST